jgi:hypothetical protein
MLGAFALGSVELGGLITTVLTPYIPIYTMRLEGDISLVAVEGDISLSSIEGGVDFL